MAESNKPEQSSESKRGRPKGSGRPVNLKMAAALSRIQCDQEEIALELGISVDTLQRRLKSDKDFQKAYNGGKNRGKIDGRRAIFTAMRDRYFTACQNPDCGRIRIDFDRFFDKCPYCKSIGKDEEGEEIEFTVKHITKDGNPRLMELFAKNYLGMSDKVEIGSDPDKPVLFSTLADFSMHMAKKHGYGRKNENPDKDNQA